jgi:filamentous hemagglutinin family protein
MQPAIADPTGGEVVNGQGQIGQSGNTTTISQQTQRLVLEWQTFNVGADEQVIFNQPGSTSVALNRIFDQNASQILGAIDANGRVFLVNPNGIIFGSTATVNVASLVASSLDISNDDFMAGNYDFQSSGEGSPGVVVNRGLLQASTGGSVTLMGGAVSNEGLVVAELGQVTLAAGSGASLDFDGDGLLFFEITGDVLQNTGGLDSAVSNSGEIEAQGGQVLLTARAAKNVFSNVVNNEGIIRAQRIDNTGGVIRLMGSGGDVYASGVLDASGADSSSTGGTVQVLGDRVALYGDASVDVSGDAGGGLVQIGGAFQGSDPDVTNASDSFVGGGVNINADARVSGDGGEVIVWADNTTQYYGEITARGGTTDGNGGFVEVSGKQNLGFHGGVDLSAPEGAGGILLLDPDNIILNNTVQTAPTDSADGTPDVPFNVPAGGDLTIEIGDVTGFSELYLQAANDIDIDEILTMDAGGSVLLEAGNNIDVNANVTVTGAGTINLTADADFSGGGGNASDGIGAITRANSSVLSQENGTMTLVAGSGINAGTDAVDISFNNSTSGDVILSEADAVTIDGTNTGGGLTLDAAGNITFSAPVLTTAGGVSVTATAGDVDMGDVDTTNATAFAAGGQVDISATGNVTVGAIDAGTSGGIGITFDSDDDAAATLNVGDLTAGGLITLTGSVTGDDGIQVDEAGGDGIWTVQGGELTISNANVAAAALTAIEISATGSVSVEDMDATIESIEIFVDTDNNEPADLVVGDLTATNFIDLQGGTDSNDTLTINSNNADVNWNISGAESGLAGDATFGGFRDQVGGAQNDLIIIDAGNGVDYAGTWNAGGGNDEFTILSGNVTGTLNGGAGADVFNIDASYNNTFSGTASGGSGNDVFNVDNGDSSMNFNGGTDDGGVGDTVSYAGSAGPVTVAIDSATAVETLVGSGWRR